MIYGRSLGLVLADRPAGGRRPSASVAQDREAGASWPACRQAGYPPAQHAVHADIRQKHNFQNEKDAKAFIKVVHLQTIKSEMLMYSRLFQRGIASFFSGFWCVDAQFGSAALS
jgi:hypothetical protein